MARKVGVVLERIKDYQLILDEAIRQHLELRDSVNDLSEVELRELSILLEDNSKGASDKLHCSIDKFRELIG